MNTQERIDKMLKKADKILQAGNENKPEQLKPCPFCGAEIGDFKTIEKAVEAWNRRVE